MRRRGPGHHAFRGLVVLLYGFLIAPIAIVVIASFNAGRFLVFPPEGLSLQWYAKFLESGPLVRSFLFSLRLAVLVTIITTVLGTAAALYVVRHARRGSRHPSRRPPRGSPRRPRPGPPEGRCPPGRRAHG